MAKYEKQKVKKIKIEKPKDEAKRATKTEKIKMKPQKEVKLPRKERKPEAEARRPKTERLTVVKGYKNLNRTKTIIWACSVIVVVGLAIFLIMLTPTGLGEFFTNTFAKMEGGDGFPQKLSGEDIINAETEGSVSHVLSTSFYETYNSNGYNLINDQHGFSNPVMKLSAARTLVFDRGGTGCKVYNYRECIAEYAHKDKIVAAHIGRDGSMAFVLNSQDYASRVEVYNRDFEHQYTWNAANETISAAAVSNNGSQLAVSTFKSVNGEFQSFIYIFEFDSASPVFTKQITGDIAISLFADGDNIWAVTYKGLYRIDWDDRTNADNILPGGVSVFDHYDGKMAVAGPDAANSLDTNLKLFDDDGVLIVNVVVPGEADDISIGDDYIFALVGHNVYAYDFEGKLVSKTEVGYDVKYLTAPTDNGFGTVSSNNISAFYFD